MSANSRQNGMVLVITLIMLVIMTLGAIAMIRTMDNTTLIAGNLSFRQSATYSGDSGVEAAMTWLTAPTTTASILTCGATGSVATCPAGYKSNGGNAADSPAAGQSWDAFWLANLAGNAVTLAEDGAGNTVSYFIHRLCEGTGALNALGANCVVTPLVASTGGNSKSAGAVKFQSSSQVYYRVTVRIQGKKNTVSYIQAMIAL